MRDISGFSSRELLLFMMVICLSGCSRCKEIPELKIYDATGIKPVTASVKGSVLSDGAGSITRYGICFSTYPNPCNRLSYNN